MGYQWKLTEEEFDLLWCVAEMIGGHNEDTCMNNKQLELLAEKSRVGIGELKPMLRSIMNKGCPQ